MKKLFLVICIGIYSFLYANVNAVVSIIPQKTFLEKIGGDKVNVTTMIKPGNSPHTYEPKPSQMKDISKADIYFTIDVEFEHNWIKKFQNQNKSMIVKYMGENISKVEMLEHSHHDDHDEHKDHDHAKEHHDDHDEHKDHDHAKEHHDDHDEHHHEGGKDPHIWTSPKNVKVIANNIFKELSKLDKENTAYYKKNLDLFLKEIEQTDKKIKELFQKTPKHTKFMVFHPAWGYFAKDYNLEQLAIESGGKNPKPKQIAHLIDEAKKEKVTAVLTAPEFSTKNAKQIAKEVGIPVIKISPLNPEWSKNLINLAKAISKK